MGERMKPRQLLRVRAHPVLVTPTPAPQGPQNGPFSRLFVTEARGRPPLGPCGLLAQKGSYRGTPVVLGQTKPPICGGGRRRHDPLHAARAQRGVNFCDPPRRALAAAARQWRCRHALTACIDARRQINIVEPLALKNVYVITRVVWSSQSPRRITNSTSKTRRLSWSCT